MYSCLSFSAVASLMGGGGAAGPWPYQYQSFKTYYMVAYIKSVNYACELH